jgi:hypothetical protein
MTKNGRNLNQLTLVLKWNVCSLFINKTEMKERHTLQGKYETKSNITSKYITDTSIL